MEFEDYYKKWGFEKYPFRDRTSEKEDTGKLFIKPEQYEMLVDAFAENQTCIINGDRGTGKTIIIDDLKRRVEKEKLVTYITNFEIVPLQNNILYFYNLILQEITRSLLIYMNNNVKKMKKLSKDDKIMLSFLIMRDGDAIADSQLKEQIERIQLSKWKRIVNQMTKLLTKIINYGGTAVANLGNQFLTNTFGKYLPNVSSDEVVQIFPDIKFKVVDDFKSVEVTYSMLNMIVERIRNIVEAPIIIFFDKFDEDSRIENDADVLATFLKDLVSDNALLLNDNLQLMISVWKIAFKGLASNFRRSKHYVYDISWSYAYLVNVLNHRLQVFSGNKIKKWQDIFEESIDSIDDILNLSNGNPRDLWDIFDKIIRTQYNLDNSKLRISREAIESGKKDFVSKFNFYEYYPKKKNARRNTNDVYSYIALLLFLDNTEEFTNEELRNAATTGGSVTNYITNMQTIGLVEKTDKKRPGGAVIYKIIDPKVIYAIYNNVEIVH